MTEQIPTVYGVCRWRFTGTYWQLLSDNRRVATLAIWAPDTKRLYIFAVVGLQKSVRDVGVYDEDVFAAATLEILVQRGIVDPLVYVAGSCQ